MRPVATLLFAFAASVANAALLIGPDRPISKPVYGPAVGEEYAYAAPTDGTDFLVFWTHFGVYASRVSAAGEVQVPPLAVRTAAVVRELSAVWTGSVYIVAWSEDDATNGRNVMMATVSRDGQMVILPHLVAQGARTFSGALAWNGSRALLAYMPLWQPSVRGALIDGAGGMIRVNVSLPVADASGDRLLDTIKVTTDGRRFAVFWRTSVYGGIILSDPPPLGTPKETYHVVRLTDSGDLVDRASVSIATTGQTGDFGVAFGAGRYAIVALERQFGDAATVRRFVVDAETLAVDALSAVPATGFAGSVTWNGSQFIAYWASYSSSSFDLMTMPFGGTPAISIHSEALGLQPILAWNGNKFLAVWTDRSRVPAGYGAGGDIFASFLDRTASGSSSRFPIAFAIRPQAVPAIATSGGESLVVWVEQTNDSYFGELLGARVGPDGTILDSEPLDLGGNVSIYSKPSVAFTGLAYFVVWQVGENASVSGRRVERDGTLGKTVDFGPGWSPAIASNRSLSLVAYLHDGDIVGVRIDGRGEVIDIPPLVIAAKRYGFMPSVATNGSDFLVVWTEGSDYWQFPTPEALNVLGARVTASGAVPGGPITIAGGPKNQGPAIVDSDGRDFLVLYLLGRGGPESQLAAKRLLREGTLAETTAADDGAIIGKGASGDMAIARDGSGYTVAWQAGGYTQSLEVAHLDTHGNPLGTVTLLTQPGYVRISPSLVVNRGALQIVYARTADEPQDGGTSRVFLRVGSTSRGRSARH